MKYISFLIMSAFAFLCYSQQRPFINNLDKKSAAPGETIFISGTGFNPGNMKVTLGAGQATVSNSTSTSIEITVPTSSTHGPVKVLDTSTGLTSTSIESFTPKFYGDGFDNTAVSSQFNFATNMKYTYDLCACDMDNDGLVDIAVANNSGTSINIFRNKSTINVVDFENIPVSLSVSTISTECGDLNGDGKPELIFTTEVGGNESNIFILLNESTPGSISYSLASSKLTYPKAANGDNRIPRKFKIADLDGDGKNDLVMGNEHDNALIIYRNLSNKGGAISLDNPIEFVVTGAKNVGSITVGDLNNDGFQDIVTLATNVSQEKIFIIQNNSSPSTIDLKTVGSIGNPETRVNVELGDFNGDNLSEIVVSRTLASDITIFENTSTSGGVISFNTNFQRTSLSNPWGLAIGDVDGDGLADITAASISSNIHVLENSSSNGTLSFAANSSISTNSSNRNIELCDINGDGKTDFITTNNSDPNSDGRLAVFLNYNCVNPSISPSDITFCTGSPFSLTSTKSTGASYNWTVESGNASISSPTSQAPMITVNSGTSVTIKCTLTSADGSCIKSDSKTYTVTAGTKPSTPTIVNDKSGTLCSGTSFTLTAPAGMNDYLWTLPDGTETSLSTNTFSVTSSSSSDAGVYLLRTQTAGSCYSEPGQLKVDIDEPPSLTIKNNGNDLFCATSSVELEVANFNGFTYQWILDNSDIAGATAQKHITNKTGNYQIKLESSSKCIQTGPTYSIKAVSPPVSDFTSEEEVCTNTSTTFDAVSSGDADLQLTYFWNFNDNGTSNLKTPSHSFASARNYDVILTTNYSSLANCGNSVTKSIKVSAPPASISIATPDGTQKCPDDSLRLEAPQNQQSYLWSNGSTKYFTYAHTSSKQDVNLLSVQVLTDIGCKVEGSQLISNFSNSRINITTSEIDVKHSGDTIILENGKSTLWLKASNGTNYNWSPAEIIDAANNENVKVYPKNQVTAVSVNGIDALNSCETTATIYIKTPGVIPRRSFSPNGDDEGFDCWEILNTDNVQGCTVYIFDERGVNVFKSSSPFANNCVWDGYLHNGSQEAPEGVYYFVMKCENSSLNKSGSILLAR